MPSSKPDIATKERQEIPPEDEKNSSQWFSAGLLAGSSPLHYLFTAMAVGIISLAGIVLAPFCGAMNMALLYLMPVLLAAVRWGRRPSVFASILGVMAFNFFFVDPQLGLKPTYQQSYFLLAVFLVVSVVTGTVASRLRSERERLRNLSVRLENIREEERTTIAREVHDELGQALTVMKLDLAQIQKKLPDNQSTLRKNVKALGEVVDDTIKVARRISTGLRPGILDELGLTAALEWLVEDYESKTGIEFHFSSSVRDVRWSKRLSTSLFRILQEALTNIVRHSQATSVAIYLEEEGDFLSLTVEDNGKGIKNSTTRAPTSLGLLGIRERAFILGGKAYISSEKGKGTTVKVMLPIREGDDRYV